jgi:hypothetical protein
MQTINLPDGTQGMFPDDMPDTEISDILKKQFPSIPRLPLSDATAAKDMARMADPKAGMPWHEKLAVGAGAKVAAAGEGLLGLADKAGATNEIGKANLAGMKENRQLYEENHPGGWATAGEVGADLGMGVLPVTKGAQLLTKALPLGRFAPAVADVGANAGYSAATAPENRGEAAALGGGGATGGRVLNRALGGAVRPSEESMLPLATGARMTPGQAGEGIMGTAARGVENVLGRMPVMGYPVRAAQRAGLRDAAGSVPEPGFLDQSFRSLGTKRNVAKVAAEIAGHKLSGGVGLTATAVSLLGTTEPGRRFLLGQMPWQELVKANPGLAAQVGRALADQGQGE